MTMRYGLAILAYVVTTFAIAFVWHLILFADYYAALQIYRSDIIVPFGFHSMLIQATIFAWAYDKMFARRSGTWLSRGLIYAAAGGLLSWSFTTIAVAAKNVMTSVPDYLLIETAFTAAQWIVVGPLTAFVFAAGARARSTHAAAA